ncbi:site-specific DNA-methyltransferase [Dietzia sp.]|uniref:site-specific DNA-methyltransferase n=1 Tax=Dietzia sp. TaxID=1871616 RepID=UPI002FD8E518
MDWVEGTSGVIRFEAERRAEGNTTGLLVRGESADALRALLDGELPVPEDSGLRGAVQAVYIDPPYNTGGAFADYSDKVDHELWLGMLRERLHLLREALTASGTLWLHIDDSEMAYAKVLLDEVFGRENLVSAIVVENNPKGRQLGKFFAGSHDHLLVYARDIRTVRLEPASAEAVNPADFPKSDERGPYRLLPLRNTNKKFHPGSVPTMHYGLWADGATGRVAADPFEGAIEVFPVFGDGSSAVWRWSAALVRERADELLARVVRGRGGERLDVFQVDRLHGERKKKLRSIWSAAEVGSSDSAKAELKKVLPGRQIFATPKPEPLLRRVLEAATEPGELVLDCFAGSGTTPVVAERMGRRWIAVELSSATVDAHLLPRLEHEGARFEVWRETSLAR